jgi:hypothetical protein
MHQLISRKSRNLILPHWKPSKFFLSIVFFRDIKIGFIEVSIINKKVVEKIYYDFFCYKTKREILSSIDFKFFYESFLSLFSNFNFRGLFLGVKGRKISEKK